MLSGYIEAKILSEINYALELMSYCDLKQL